MTPEDIRYVQVNPNDPEVLGHAHEIVLRMLDHFGEAMTVGIMVRGTQELLEALLHAPSPMPEANIEAVEKLLDALRGNVLSHVSCARNNADPERKVTVH